jgi:agmatine deiminase
MNALKPHMQESVVTVKPEWAKQKTIWTAFPSAEDLWLENLHPARAEFVQMVQALAGDHGQDQCVDVVACGEDAYAEAQKSLGSCARIHNAPFGDIWLRDTGPIFANHNSMETALRFQTNGWGGKYDLEFDDKIGDTIAHLAQTPIKSHDFILEGGAIEQDGTGLLLTTRQCLLNKNRNANWDEAKATEILKETFGVRKILWLDQGLINDHTDGHIDNIARFIAPSTVVCQSPASDNDPNKDIYEAIYIALKSMTDVWGAPLRVVQIPSPDLVENEDGDIVPASHMNFIIGNKTVVMPHYNTETAEAARQALAQYFPTRKVVAVASQAILSGGGSFHCITQQQPE